MRSGIGCKVLVGLALGLLAPVLGAESANPDAPLTIAVLDLQPEGLEQSTARIISDRLRSALLHTRAFVVLERGQMEEILKEQGFQQSGCVAEQCYVEVGQLLGVSHMVGGSIGKVEKTISINLRLIDVSSGVITHTVTHDCECTVDEILQRWCGYLAERMASEVRGEAGPKKPFAVRKRRQVVRRIVFGTLSAACVGGAIWADAVVAGKMADNESIRAAYDAEPTNQNYDEYSDDYQENWDDAQTSATIRNVLYGAAGAFAVGFAISIPF
ncbi:MAG: hypothetical protein GF331_00525 [Chitinivibrionales bacterium]|nr:hypothetical protein [Chitinivibrionales bacterium]